MQTDKVEMKTVEVQKDLQHPIVIEDSDMKIEYPVPQKKEVV